MIPVAATHRGQAGICTADPQPWPPSRAPREPQKAGVQRSLAWGGGGSHTIPPSQSPRCWRRRFPTSPSSWVQDTATPKRQHLVLPAQHREALTWSPANGVPSSALSPPPSWFLCRGRQGAADAPTPGEFPTLVSCFKEHFKCGSITTKSALISSLQTRAGVRTSWVPAAQQVSKKPRASRGGAGASWQEAALEELP